MHLVFWDYLLYLWNIFISFDCCLLVHLVELYSFALLTSCLWYDFFKNECHWIFPWLWFNFCSLNLKIKMAFYILLHQLWIINFVVIWVLSQFLSCRSMPTSGFVHLHFHQVIIPATITYTFHLHETLRGIYRFFYFFY